MKPKTKSQIINCVAFLVPTTIAFIVGVRACKAAPVETVEIRPEATITTVCEANYCTSSWVPHITDPSAIGNMPDTFVIPEQDKK